VPGSPPFRKVTQLIDKVIDLLSRIGLICGSVLLAVMMVLTVVDVFMRYVFSAPLPSVAELTQIMLSMTVFAGFILVSRDGSHIVVSLFESTLTRLAPRTYRLLYAISNAVGTAFILWVLILAARDSFVFKDVTEVLEIPFIWILAVLAVSAAFALVTSISVFTKGPVGHGSTD